MPAFRGFAFPFTKGSSALPASSSDNELIRQSILQILTTVRGERVMRPTFGVNAIALLFESNDEDLAALLKVEVMDGISRFEPRVSVQGVAVERNVDEGSVTVDISYIVIPTRSVQQLQMEFPLPDIG